MLWHRAGDGGKKARSPGRVRRKPLKPFACGNAGMYRRTCGDELVCFILSHTRLRVRVMPPAFPTPFGADAFQPLGQIMPRDGGGVSCYLIARAMYPK